MHAPRRTAAALIAAGAAVLAATATIAPAEASTDVLTLSDSSAGRVAYVRAYYTDLGETLRIDRLSLSTASHKDIKAIKSVRLSMTGLWGKKTVSLGTITRTTGVAVGQTTTDPSTLTLTGTVDVSLAPDWGFWDSDVAS
jgi:hypothetical protein